MCNLINLGHIKVANNVKYSQQIMKIFKKILLPLPNSTVP